MGSDPILRAGGVLRDSDGVCVANGDSIAHKLSLPHKLPHAECDGACDALGHCDGDYDSQCIADSHAFALTTSDTDAEP